jgi:branched-chain amino acid transport system permease protein
LTKASKLIYFFIFLVTILGIVPWLIEISGRWDYYYTLTSVALLSIASSGVWLTFYIGRINIGQGAYALAGGYVVAILVTKYDVSFWLSVPIAGLFCSFVSMLIGASILRLRGVYFAMITLVLTEVAKLTAMSLPITNGAKGISSIALPGELSIFGIIIIPDFSTLANVKLAFYYVAVILMIFVFAGMYRLVNSRIGHLCRSLQQNEELASSIGVNITILRIIAYSISSFLGGIGGAIFVSISQSVYPTTFQVADSINFMLNVFVGGMGYVFGPMIGTLFIYFGWDLLFTTGKYQLLIYSSIIIALILVLPNGLLSLRIFNKSNKREIK